MTNEPKTEAASPRDAEGGERIAKVLARAGLCSRREAEEWIAAGRVAVGGKTLTTPAVTVGPNDRITVDGNPLPTKERTRLWLFHKPRGLVTTTHDPEGRPTVFSVLPEDMPRVVTIGRLDINTEGLLLLTNDGGLARVLELPATGWLRRYRVRAYGEVDERDLKELEHGVSLDGIDYCPIEAAIERVQGHNTWLVLGLREGKNREVKRVLASLGLTVNRLIRISFGPFQLADLEEGEIREIRGRVLRDQLGKRLVAESGADFDAPLVHHLQGGEDEEAPKRRIRGFTPHEEKPKRDGRTPRTKMEFIGTGERRRDDEGGDRPRFRSEGFRDRGGAKSSGFRDRPEGGRPRGEGFGGKPRSEGFRDRDGSRSGGFRDRPEGGAPRGEGFGGKPRSEGFRDRGPKAGGFRDRPDAGGEGGRGGRGDWDFKVRPKSPMRPDGAPGRGRPDGAPGRGRPERGEGGEGAPGGRMRSEGFRGNPAGGAGGGEGRWRSQGFKGRPAGGASEGGEAAERPARSAGSRSKPDTAGFGPRGPRGMNPGDRHRPERSAPAGDRQNDGGEGRPRGGRGPGGEGSGPRGGSGGGKFGGPGGAKFGGRPDGKFGGGGAKFGGKPGGRGGRPGGRPGGGPGKGRGPRGDRS